MSTPFEPRDDFETRLAAAMRSEADSIVPAGDGLAKIRARTQGRAGFFGWLTRPAAAGGILVVALVAATLAGMQLASDDDGDSISVEPKPDPIVTTLFGPATIPNDQADDERYNPDPGPDVPGTGGETPAVSAELTPPPTDAPKLLKVLPGQEENKSDGGIPVDDGHSNYVAITAPLSGRSYGSPLTIAGQARVFEAQVTIDVSQNGTVLQQTHTTASAGAPELGDWQVTIDLAPGAYRIDAYALSPKDGETRLASDSIWITVKSPEGATQPTPTRTPTSAPSPSPGATAGPTSTAPPRSDVPGTEPQ
ncbi:MAG TPA: Gmad2 immunoglobulin-like domain-containing protein [Sporichthya sp.]|nr:Gmad2 immunoglobulin-like domain-containing protein [Sporichthya sp.]